MPETAEETKAKLLARRRTTPIKSADLLSSGDTILNLMVTGKPRGCYAKGCYYFQVGDSNSGKTWVILTMFAEACLNKNFKDYSLIYDEPEGGARMDMSAFFGDKLEKRLFRQSSLTVEDFYYHLDDILNTNSPFIYVLDSMDLLRTKEENDQFIKLKKKSRGEIKGDVSGSYGTAKAKLNKQNLGRVIPRLKESGSILFIVGQSIANIGYGSVFNPQTFSGGEFLKFSATLQMWFSPAGKIRTGEIRGKKREQGMYAKVQLKKNRLTGRDRSVEIPIYHSHGIDDTGHCIDWMIEEGFWKESRGLIDAKEFGHNTKKENLVMYIEQNSLQLQLQDLIAKCWSELEESIAIERKSRYV
jgi:RecA/RadA recombinase